MHGHAEVCWCPCCLQQAGGTMPGHAEVCWCPCCLQSCISSPQEQHNFPGHLWAQLFSKWVGGKGLCMETLGHWRKRIWEISAQLSFLLLWSLSTLHGTVNSCSCMDLFLAVTLHGKTMELATFGYPHLFSVPSRKAMFSGEGIIWPTKRTCTSDYLHLENGIC